MILLTNDEIKARYKRVDQEALRVIEEHRKDREKLIARQQARLAAQEERAAA